MPLAAESRGRISFDEMFISMCHIVSERSTCLRNKSGCLIVRDGAIVALGYNGAPKGMAHCSVQGCLCEENGLGVDSQPVPVNDQNMYSCRGVHAIQNALIQAGIEKARGATLYINQMPCAVCAKLVIQAEIERVVIAAPDNHNVITGLLKQAGIQVVILDLPRLYHDNYDKRNGNSSNVGS